MLKAELGEDVPFVRLDFLVKYIGKERGGCDATLLELVEAGACMMGFETGWLYLWRNLLTTYITKHTRFHPNPHDYNQISQQKNNQKEKNNEKSKKRNEQKKKDKKKKKNAGAGKKDKKTEKNSNWLDFAFPDPLIQEENNDEL